MFRPNASEDSCRTRRADASRPSAPSNGSLLDEMDQHGAESPGRPIKPVYRSSAQAEQSAEAILPNAGQASGARIRQDDDASAALEARLQAQWQSVTRIGIGHVLHWLQRGLPIILGMAVLGAVIAFGYASTATPRYTVYTDLIVDPSNFNVTPDDLTAVNPQRDSQLLEVDSKIRVMTSGNVLRQVIRNMKLTEDAEFFKPSLLSSLFGGGTTDATQETRELAVQRMLEERIKATREERSFVVVLSVWTSDPEKSIRLSNAVVEAFQAQLFESSSESAGRIAASINARLDELRASVTKAEEQVEQFKRDNKLQSSAGELTSSRISSALDTQVLDAQQRLIQAETRYNQMRAAVADRRTASATIFDSAAMTTMRGNFTALEQQIGAMTRTYGSRHPRLVAMQSERATLEQAINEEAERILQQAKQESDQARTTLTALRGRSDAERATVFTNNDAQVRLRDLERDARARAAVYETYLTRTNQISERQEIDTSNVRVISNPVPPKTRSWPPATPLLVAGGGVAGAVIGIGLALVFGLFVYLRNVRPQPLAA
ncbi:GumC family protein [Neorhizobium sp. NPDC001467]|uniref:GumC family protein n=1 Tax=Neorhizobium sp. NPDC001467 TaxID=3390595 RepID=UPI003D07A28B